MRRFIIENVKCGITEGGMACGPVGGNVVGTVQFKEKDKSQWISLVEVLGIPNFFLFDEDVHDELVKEDSQDERFDNYVNNHFINEFNGIEFGTDYSDTFESFSNDPENPAIPLIRYLITLVRCDMDEVEGLINMAIGKYADELEIPTNDVEEDCMDEYCEDDGI